VSEIDSSRRGLIRRIVNEVIGLSGEGGEYKGNNNAWDKRRKEEY
jgi:hypothetical protein